MNDVTLTLQALVEEFVSVASGIRSRRWRLGEIYNSMCKVASANAAEKALRRAMPNAKDELGYVLSKHNLELMGKAARAFAATGGFLSPDGEHVIPREDIEALGLTPQQTGDLVDLLKAEKVRVKSVAKQAEKARKAITPNKAGQTNPDKQREAQERVLSMVANSTDDKPKRTVATIATEIEALDKQIANLAEKRKALQAEMVALNAERAATIASPPAPRKAARRRVSHQASVTA